MASWWRRLTSLFRAATPDNPRFSLNDPAAWDALLAGDPASSGVPVNRQTALAYSPWWRGINLIAGDAGKLALHVYRRVGGRDAGKERDPAHVAYPLLRRKPNAYQTAFQFRRQLTAHALASGNGYAYILRDGAGRPLELLPLDPDTTFPVRADGRLLYVTEAAGEKRKLLAENVLHIKGLGHDGLCGYGVVDKAREGLGLGIGSRKYASVYFRNSGRPAVLLEAPGRVDDKAKKTLKEDWDRLYSGLDNAHRTAILDNGLKAKVLAFSAQDTQLIETMTFSLLEVANFLGLPPHKVGHPGRTAYASLEQENQSYLDESLDPWLIAWEEECWDKLLSEQEKSGDTHVVEFFREDLVRADLTTRANYYRTALGGAPWMTRNEVRGRENMNPVDGGDDLVDPLNMGRGGAANEPAPPGKPPAPGPADARAEAEAAGRLTLEDAARRMVRRLGHAAARAARKPAAFLGWLDADLAGHHEPIADTLALGAGLAGHDPGELARTLADWVRAELLETAGACKAAELEARVGARLALLESVLPARLARVAFGDHELGAAA